MMAAAFLCTLEESKKFPVMSSKRVSIAENVDIIPAWKFASCLRGTKKDKKHPMYSFYVAALAWECARSSYIYMESYIAFFFFLLFILNSFALVNEP